MSSPMNPSGTQDPVRGAIGEITDAISALNMHPKSIPVEQQVPNNEGYLSYTDAWAQHAADHLRAAVEFLRVAENRESNTVRLLQQMLAAGQVSERDMYNLLCDIKEKNITPGEEATLHMRYLRFRHAMEQGDG